MTIEDYTHEAVVLLSRLIATPSVSGDEAKAADIMAECIAAYGLKPQREGNNVWVVAPGYDENRPTLLLNAHLDTVRWTRGQKIRLNQHLMVTCFTDGEAMIAVVG